MKTLITTFALLIMFAVGCTDQTGITSPEQPVQTLEPNWISLPQSSSSGMQVNTEWETSERINGAQGGFLTNSVTYSGGIFGTVTINAKLEFQQGAYAGNKTISMKLTDENTSVQFNPAKSGFARLVLYNVTYTGLNLSGLDPTKVKFAYIGADGSTEYAENEGITVNIATGTLSVKNAIIPHFSRYGFVN